jgi:hypothetical protein
MSRITADCWKCEWTDCRHVWLAASDVPPSHCAKCRKRGWNTALSVPPVQSMPKPVPVAPEAVSATKPEGLKKVRMCHKHNQPADTCSGMSCKQDRQALLDRAGG